LKEEKHVRTASSSAWLSSGDKIGRRENGSIIGWTNEQEGDRERPSVALYSSSIYATTIIIELHERFCMFHSWVHAQFL
jgi:hypothetical protein